MDIWRSLEGLFRIYQQQITTAIMLAVLGWCLYWLYGYWQRNQELRREQAEQRAAAARQSQALRERQRAERLRAEEQRLEAIRRKAEQAAAERAKTEQAIVKQVHQEQEEMDRAINEWNALMQEEENQSREGEIAAARAAAVAIESKINEVDKALTEWEVDGIVRGDLKPAPRPTTAQSRETAFDKKAHAVREQLTLVARAVEKEVEDLEYVINKMQTGIDFLPIQVQETINRWKDGEIYRRSTLDDLKLKFRYQAYSIDDGLELLYMYEDWIIKQRQRLLKFIVALGTEPGKTESLLSAVERAERTEWTKNLDINMDVIASLKEIREIYQATVGMEQRLKDLDKVCRKRSEQIIHPQWEPKGTL